MRPLPNASAIFSNATENYKWLDTVVDVTVTFLYVFVFVIVLYRMYMECVPECCDANVWVWCSWVDACCSLGCYFSTWVCIAPSHPIHVRACRIRTEHLFCFKLMLSTKFTSENKHEKKKHKHKSIRSITDLNSFTIFFLHAFCWFKQKSVPFVFKLASNIFVNTQLLCHIFV